MEFMKLRIALTGILLLFLWGCSHLQSHKAQGLGILVDLTEGCQHRQLITQNGIQRQLGITDDHRAPEAYTAYTSTITDVPLNPIYHFHLESLDPLANPEIRKEDAENFVDRIAKSIPDSSEGCQAMQATYLYASLKTMVESMQNDVSLDNRTVIMATDGFEHSTASLIGTRQDKICTKAIIKQLETVHGAFPDVSGFSFIILHRPKVGESLRGVNFWKIFLENRGAKVHVKAAL